MKKFICVFLAIYLINSIIISSKAYSQVENSDKIVLDIIIKSNTLAKSLKATGELAYESKINDTDNTAIMNDLKKYVDELDSYRVTLANLSNDASLNNMQKRNALIGLMGVGYYKLAAQDLIYFLTSTDASKAFSRLNRYLYSQYIGETRLFWLESQLKSYLKTD